MPRKKAEVVEEVVEEEVVELVVEEADSPSEEVVEEVNLVLEVPELEVVEEVVEYDPLVYPEYRPITFIIPQSLMATQLPIERANVSAVMRAGGYRFASQQAWRDPGEHIQNDYIWTFLVTLVRDY